MLRGSSAARTCAGRMKRRPVGYYVHHQGAGHWQRACLIARALDRPVTLIGTLAEIRHRASAPGPALDLPDDRLLAATSTGGTERPSARMASTTRRSAPTMCARGWGASRPGSRQPIPALMVVDVSVEIALFARLMSVPTLVVRLAGTPHRHPHLEAFRSAERLLAFFPPELEAAGDAGLGPRQDALCRAAAPDDRMPRASRTTDGSILVIYGRGGDGRPRRGSRCGGDARCRSGHWHVLGPVDGGLPDLPANLHLHGWVADPAPYPRPGRPGGRRRRRRGRRGGGGGGKALHLPARAACLRRAGRKGGAPGRDRRGDPLPVLARACRMAGD